MSKVRNVMFAIAVMLAGALSALLPAGPAYADGPVIYAGDELRMRCSLPQTYTDGSPFSGDATVSVYATQTPPTVGEALGEFDACGGVVSTAGLPAGQWHLYARVTQDGRPPSELSAAAPFWLAPALTVAPGNPTDLVLERIPAGQ